MSVMVHLSKNYGIRMVDFWLLKCKKNTFLGEGISRYILMNIKMKTEQFVHRKKLK